MEFFKSTTMFCDGDCWVQSLNIIPVSRLLVIVSVYVDVV